MLNRPSPIFQRVPASREFPPEDVPGVRRHLGTAGDDELQGIALVAVRREDDGPAPLRVTLALCALVVVLGVFSFCRGYDKEAYVTVDSSGEVVVPAEVRR